MTETYERIGDADVLKFEDNPVAEEVANQGSNPTLQDAATSPTPR